MSLYQSHIRVKWAKCYKHLSPFLHNTPYFPHLVALDNFHYNSLVSTLVVSILFSLRAPSACFVTFLCPCIVTNFFITKPTRCINFPNLFWHETLHVSDSSSVHHQEFIHCTLKQWYMSYRFVDSFRTGPGWNRVPSWSCSKALFKPVWHIPVPSVQWINSWWWVEEVSETCRVSCQNKFGKLVHLVVFIIKNPLRLCLVLMCINGLLANSL